MNKVRDLKTTKTDDLGVKLADFRATIKSLVSEVAELQKEVLILKFKLK